MCQAPNRCGCEAAYYGIAKVRLPAAYLVNFVRSQTTVCRLLGALRQDPNSARDGPCPPPARELPLEEGSDPEPILAMSSPRRDGNAGQACCSYRGRNWNNARTSLTGLCKHTLTRGSDLRTVAGQGHCWNDSPLEQAVFGGSGDPVSHWPST